MSTHAEVWARLRDAGEVDTALPPSTALPWSVRIVLGVGAWVASLCALIFIAFTLGGMLDAAPVRWFLVVVTAGMAWHLAPQVAVRPFAGQIGCVAACLMQALLLWSLLAPVRDPPLAGLAILLSGLAGLPIALPIWRTWCALLALAGLLLTTGALLGGVAAVVVLLLVTAAGHQALLHPRWMRRYPGLYWPGLTGVLLGTGLYSVWNPALGWSGWLWLGWMPPTDPAGRLTLLSAGLGLIHGLTAWTLARRLRVRQTVALLWAGAPLILAAATWNTPLVSALSGLMVLGYAMHHRLLLICSAAAWPIALGLHYYTLSWTLQAKGLSLLALGAGLLVLRVWLGRTQEQPR